MSARSAGSVILTILGSNKGAKAAVDDTVKLAAGINALKPTLNIGADTKGLDVGLAKAQAGAAAINKLTGNVKFGIDLSGLNAALTAIAAKVRGGAVPPIMLKATLDGAPAVADLTALKAELAKIATNVHLRLDASDNLSALSSDSKQAATNISALAVAMSSAGGQASRWATLSAAAGAALGALNLGVGRGTGAWGLWGGKVQLFAGLLTKLRIPMLATIGTVHVLADAVIEIAAVVIPAAIALTAFGIAGAQAAVNIYDRMTAVRSVMDATGKVLPPFTAAFGKLQDAVRPQVYQLFGDALTIINSKTGIFAMLAKGAGAVVDNLAARITAAMTASGGLGSILAQHAIPDLQQLGTLVGNLAGIFGNLLHSMPGIAEALLNMAVGFTHFIENITGSTEPLIKFVVTLHGIILWGGLAASAILWLGTRILMAFAPVAGLIGAAIVSLVALGLEVVQTTINFGLLEGAMVVLDALNPWGWVALGVAALGLLVFAMVNTKSAASSFVDSLNSKIAKLSIAQTIPGITSAIGALNAKIKETGKTADELAKPAVAFGKWQTVMKDTGVQKATADIATYTGAIHKYLDQANTEFKVVAYTMGITTKSSDVLTQGMKPLTHQFSSVTEGIHSTQTAAYSYDQALEIMTLAGVKNTDSMGVQIIKVQGLLAGYKAMGVQGGTLGNAVNALSFALDQQDSKVLQLTQAYSTFISMVTGSQTALVAFGQGLSTMGQNAKVAGASITGLNDQSLTLRSTFESNITAALGVYNALQLQAQASGNGAQSTKALAQAGKDLIASLLPMAKGSQTATDQIYALAQVAGYKGADSFKGLSEWIGKTIDPMANLDVQTGKLTHASADLVKDVTNLSNSLSQTLSNAMSSAIFQAEGGQKAFNNFANAVVGANGNVTEMVPAADSLYKTLLTTTGSATTAKNEFYAFAYGMGLTKAQADQLWASIDHGGKVMDQQHQARAVFNADIQKILDKAPNAKTDINNLTTAIKDHGVKSDQERGARAKLISDLEQSGVNARTATGLVDNLIKALGRVPSHVPTTITETIKGIGKIAINASGAYIQGENGHIVAAAQGMLVTGGIPGKDSVLINAMPGEAIVPTGLVPAVAPILHAGGVPGFAAGGIVGGGDSLAATAASYVSGVAGSMVAKFETGATNAFIKGFQKAMSAVGSGASIVPYAESFVGKVPYVWGGSSPSGWDCSGFTSYVYNHFGLGAPRTSQAQAQWVRRTATPQLGGLAFFVGSDGTSSAPGHVGIVVGNNRMVDAYGTGFGTRFDSLGGMLWTGIPPQGFLRGGGQGGAPSTSGSVVQWLQAAMANDGLPQSWLRGLEQVVQAESGGNPRAYNPTPVNGQHAEGLMQMLPSTYAAFATIPGGIWNPISNASAAGRYIMSRYGSVYNIPGLGTSGYKGYALGGIITEPIFGMGLNTGTRYSLGERGPEMVTPMSGAASRGGGDVINIYVQGDSDPDGAAKRIHQKLRDYRRHRGGQRLGLD